MVILNKDIRLKSPKPLYPVFGLNEHRVLSSSGFSFMMRHTVSCSPGFTKSQELMMIFQVSQVKRAASLPLASWLPPGPAEHGDTRTSRSHSAVPCPAACFWYVLFRAEQQCPPTHHHLLRVTAQMRGC